MKSEVVDKFHTETKIAIFGVGGAGCQLAKKVAQQASYIEAFLIDTDSNNLEGLASQSLTPKLSKLLLGISSKNVIFAKIGTSNNEVRSLCKAISDYGLVFVAAGLGKGTGSRVAPIICEAARNKEVFTLAFVVMPFSFEDITVRSSALTSLKVIAGLADTAFVTANDRGLRALTHDLRMSDAYKTTDEIVIKSILSVADLVAFHGEICIGYSDIKGLFSKAGLGCAMLSAASGENRAKNASNRLLSNSLAAGIPLDKASRILVCFKDGGGDLLLSDVQDASYLVSRAARKDADVLRGLLCGYTQQGCIEMTTLISGFEMPDLGELSPQTHVESLFNKPKQKNDKEDQAGCSKKIRFEKRQSPRIRIGDLLRIFHKQGRVKNWERSETTGLPNYSGDVQGQKLTGEQSHGKRP